MAGLIQSEINKILTGYFKDTQYTTPNNLYLGLYTDNPLAGNKEASYSGYDRIPLTNKMGSPANGSITNNEQLIFNEKTDSGSVNITHFAICKNNTKGDDSSILFVGEFVSPITVEQNYAVVIEAGSLKVIFS